MLRKQQIETFLIGKSGYLKKSPIETAKAIWKDSPKHTHPKDKKELQKELDLIKEVQSDLRRAKTLETEVVDNQLIDIYQKIIEYKNRPKKRLYFDIETSPNVTFSWRIGRKINLSTEDILQERAIICVCWKWENDEKVHSLQWDKGNDKDLLTKFSKVMDSADEVIGQNSDKFDIKWLRTRCIFHDIALSPKFNSIDTLKLAKSGFNFNSNKLDYMGGYLGLGNKIKTEYGLWKEIVLNNSKEAMNKMILYCQEDVRLLERVHHKLENYTPPKKFKYKL